MHALLLASSALFAWSMGSHYTGSVAGTAYGADVLSVCTALLLTAALKVVGSVVGSVNVVMHVRRSVRDVAVNWTVSPLLGLAGLAFAIAVLETIVA